MNTKKLIALILAFVLVFCNAFSVNAVGVIGEMITELPGMNRLTVSAALNAYFNSREAFLLNQTDTINALFSSTADEISHKEKYIAENIIFIDSAISIADIIVGDTYADASVIETVTYSKTGIVHSTTVSHTLLLGLGSSNVPTVVYDGYYEEFSGFRSCAYVDEASMNAANTIGGSGSCIVHKAEGQLDYTEGPDEYTKYGEWYSELDAAGGYDFSHSAWCVMFVVWCAAHVNISKSIIDHKANQVYLQNFFIDQDRYHSRTAAVGDWAPSTGDLIFFADDRVNASHIGIVRYVDANCIYVVHGNNSQGKVAFMTVSRTNDWILGYAKPAYASSGHTYNLIRDKDDTQHWHSCANCGIQGAKEPHSPEPEYDFDNQTHWINCIGCPHKYIDEAHTLTYAKLSNIHQASCATCGYTGEWTAHSAKGYDNDDVNHWQDCSSCGYRFGEEKHTYMQMAGNIYTCSVCCYQTNSPWGGNDIEEELQ